MSVVSFHELTWPQRRTVGFTAELANPIVPYTYFDNDDGYYWIDAVTESPGQDPFTVYQDTAFDEIRNPVPSPDGLMVAYDQRISGYSSVLVVPTAGGTPTMLEDGDGASEYAMHPFWRHDNGKIIYTLSSVSSNAGGDIYEINPDGTGRTLLLDADDIHAEAACWRPHYNCDGTRISFVVLDDGAGTPSGIPIELWVMDADGSNAAMVETLVGKTLAASQHSWHPTDPDVLAYYEGGSTPGDVYVINYDGTGKTQINVSSSGSNTRLTKFAWAPDGETVFATVREYNSNIGAIAWVIHAMLADGSSDTVLYDGYGLYASATGCEAVRRYGNRLYFVPDVGGDGNRVSSIALNGTDYRVEHDITTVATRFFTGSAFEYL